MHRLCRGRVATAACLAALLALSAGSVTAQELNDPPGRNRPARSADSTNNAMNRDMQLRQMNQQNQFQQNQNQMQIQQLQRQNLPGSMRPCGAGVC